MISFAAQTPDTGIRTSPNYREAQTRFPFLQLFEVQHLSTVL